MRCSLESHQMLHRSPVSLHNNQTIWTGGICLELKVRQPASWGQVTQPLYAGFPVYPQICFWPFLCCALQRLTYANYTSQAVLLSGFQLDLTNGRQQEIGGWEEERNQAASPCFPLFGVRSLEKAEWPLSGWLSLCWAFLPSDPRAHRLLPGSL